MTYDIRGDGPTRELQKYLLEVSYATHGLPHIAIDGIFGPETEDALRLFQEGARLPVTGVADGETWEELYRQYEAARRARLYADEPPLRHQFPLIRPMENSDVALIQILLSEIDGALYPIGTVPQSGRYDLVTERAVRAYQEYRSLPLSGAVDEETLFALWEDYKNLPPPPEARKK